MATETRKNPEWSRFIDEVPVQEKLWTPGDSEETSSYSLEADLGNLDFDVLEQIRKRVYGSLEDMGLVPDYSGLNVPKSHRGISVQIPSPRCRQAHIVVERSYIEPIMLRQYVETIQNVFMNLWNQEIIPCLEENGVAYQQLTQPELE